MPFPPAVDLLNNPVGTPFDEPAGAGALVSGQGATLFALLKGILAQLLAGNEEPNSIGVPEA